MMGISAFRMLAVVSALSLCGSAQAQSLPQAVRLKEVKDLDRLDPNWIIGICNLPGIECNKVEAPRLFERKLGQNSEYYALMPGLILARLTLKAPDQWRLQDRWNFRDYPVTMKNGNERPAMLDIHPALYPAGPNLWAVAVLSSRTEAYSGGGAQFTTADFVMLDPKVTRVGAEQRLFGGVPFSCSKLVRACFSEKEYRTSPHCHEESTGYLTLTFAPTSASRLHDWTATWHQTIWPAGVPKSAQTKTQTRASLIPGPQGFPPGTFSFCEATTADQ